MNNEVLKQKLFEAVKQKGLIVEQANGGKKDFTEMMSLLLHSQTQVHTFHLQCKSYAEHKALQKYYEGIDGLVDTLVESYQGKYSILKGYKQYPIDDYKDTTTTVNYFKELCDKVMELRDCCKDSWIQNQIDNVCELINSTLYKLRYLK
jgi:hypothetical protein